MKIFRIECGSSHIRQRDYRPQSVEFSPRTMHFHVRGSARLKRAVIFTLLAALLSSFPVFGQEERESMYYLGEVVVSGSNPVLENTATISVVSADAIAEQGAQTVDEALESIPGVIVRTANEGSPRIDIRGFRTRNVLLLMNGVPFNSTFDGQFDPSTLSVENIAEIRVIRGGSGSVLYGPYGNGGVIDIITKSGGEGIHVSFSSEAEQRDSYLGKVTVSGAAGKVNAFLSGSVLSSTGFPLSNFFQPTIAENGGLRLSSDNARRNLYANIDFAPGENTSLGLSIQYRNGEYGIPPVTTDPNDPFTKRAKFDRMDRYDGTAVQLAGSHLLTKSFALRSWVFLNQLNEEKNGYNDATFSAQTANGTYHSDASSLVSGGNTQLMYDKGAWGMTTVGVSGEVLSWEDNGFENKNKKTILNGTRKISHFSTAIEYQVSLFERLGISAGVGVHFQSGDIIENDGDFTYLLSAAYHLDGKTNITLSHSRKILFPSIRQLFEPFGGTPGLKPEITVHYEAGIERILPMNSSISLAGYFINAENFIEKDTDEIYRNYESYRFRGFDLTTALGGIPRTRLTVAYSYLRARNMSKGAANDILQYRPQDKVSVITSCLLPYAVTGRLSLIYMGKQYTLGNNALWLKKRLNTYTVCDVQFSRPLAGEKMKCSIGANNLFDRNYEESYGLPQAGRMVTTAVEYAF